MTEMAAPATSGWIRFEDDVLSIVDSCDMDNDDSIACNDYRSETKPKKAE
jgi:hypothetical protein